MRSSRLNVGGVAANGEVEAGGMDEALDASCTFKAVDGAEAPALIVASTSTSSTSFPFSVASLAGASATLEEVLSYVAWPLGAMSASTEPETSRFGLISISMAEVSGMMGDDGPAGLAEGMATRVGGAVVGEGLADEPLVNMSRMFFDPPTSLEDRFKLTPAFLLKRTRYKYKS